MTKKSQRRKYGYISVALLAIGVICYFTAFTMGGEAWIDTGISFSSFPAYLCCLGAILMGISVLTSIAGTFGSQDLTQRILSIACLTLTFWPAYHAAVNIFRVYMTTE